MPAVNRDGAPRARRPCPYGYLATSPGSSPDEIALDGQFVYWVDDGVAVDGGVEPATASIYRIAKP
jgi:hypothetical protein